MFRFLRYLFRVFLPPVKPKPEPTSLPLIPNQTYPLVVRTDLKTRCIRCGATMLPWIAELNWGQVLLFRPCTSCSHRLVEGVDGMGGNYDF